LYFIFHFFRRDCVKIIFVEPATGILNIIYTIQYNSGHYNMPNTVRYLLINLITEQVSRLDIPNLGHHPYNKYPSVIIGWRKKRLFSG